MNGGMSVIGSTFRTWWADWPSRTCPTGKSLLISRNRVKSRNQKYFCFRPTQISSNSCRPVPQEGRLAIVTNAGRDAMDVGSARDERGLLAYGQVLSF